MEFRIHNLALITRIDEPGTHELGPKVYSPTRNIHEKVV